MKTDVEQLDEMEQMVLMGRFQDALMLLIRFLRKKYETR